MIPAISDAGHPSVHAGPRPGVGRWMRVLSGAFVAVIFAMLLTLSAPPASAQSERLSEQERRIGGLVKTGRAMLSNQQYARAYKHFLTYTRQEPEEARLYRWLVLSSIYAERKDALTELMTEAAAQAEANEQAAADQREADARQRAAELRSSDYVQSCVNGEWNYPLFIRYPREWQVSFTLSLNQNGDIAEVERGSVAAEDDATNDQLSAFVQSAESALYSCEPFLNPTGASGEAFEIEVVMQPRSIF